MKTKTAVILLVLVAFAAGLLGSQLSTLNSQPLPPLSSEDRETLIADLRELADDDSGWWWIEYYEVGYPTTNPDAYLSAWNFRRLKETRRQALRDAAWILEHYAPPARPAAAR